MGELDELAERTKLADARAALALAEQKEAEARTLAEAARRQSEGTEKVAARTAAVADAEAAQSVAEAQAARVKALLPDDPKLAPLEDDVEADDKSGIVAAVVARALQRTGARNLAAAIKAAPGIAPSNSHLLVVPDRDLSPTAWVYQSVKQQIHELDREVRTVTTALRQQTTPGDPAVGTAANDDSTELRSTSDDGSVKFGLPPAVVTAALAAAPQVIGAIGDAFGYFQSNYQLSGKEADIGTNAGVAALVGALASSVKVTISGFSAPNESTLLSSYSSLLEDRFTLLTERTAFEQSKVVPAAAVVARATADLAARKTALTSAESKEQPEHSAIAAATQQVERADATLRTAEREHGELRGQIAAAIAVEARVTALESSLTAPSKGSEVPALGRAVTAEQLFAEDSDVTHLVFFEVHDLGSETQTRKRRFRSPTIRYVGTVGISVVVADRAGKVEMSDVATLIGEVEFQLKNGEIRSLRSVDLQVG